MATSPTHPSSPKDCILWLAVQHTLCIAASCLCHFIKGQVVKALHHKASEADIPAILSSFNNNSILIN